MPPNRNLRSLRNNRCISSRRNRRNLWQGLHRCLSPEQVPIAVQFPQLYPEMTSEMTHETIQAPIRSRQGGLEWVEVPPQLVDQLLLEMETSLSKLEDTPLPTKPKSLYLLLTLAGILTFLLMLVSLLPVYAKRVHQPPTVEFLLESPPIQ